MRVIVSGTHGSGKSALIGDFSVAHRNWAILPDPYEFIELAADEPGTAVFVQQLRIAAHRLLEPHTGHALAERGPLDFLAYLHAIESLGRSTAAPDLLEWGYELTGRAMRGVDLLVLLPLNGVDAICIGAEEDLELRDAMNMALLELADEPDLTGSGAVVEITGTREDRLTSLESAIHTLAGPSVGF